LYPVRSVESLEERKVLTSIIGLGTLPGGNFSGATGINDIGQIVGYSDTTDAPTVYPGQDDTHAFFESNGTLYDLGILDEGRDIPGQSYAYAVNDSGSVVGFTDVWLGDDLGSAVQAFACIGNAEGNPGNMFDLGTFPGLYPGRTSSAMAINDVGIIAGYSELAYPDDQFSHAYVVDPSDFDELGTSEFVDLGTLGGYSSGAEGINQAGQVVGWADTGGLVQHAFVFTPAPGTDGYALSYTDGVMSDLGTLGGTNSTAYAIDDSGQVVGESEIAGNAAYHAFVYADGSMDDLGTLGGTDSYATGISDSGQIVGMSQLPSGTWHPFIDVADQMIDLNQLLPPDSGWTLLSTPAINNASQIVGTGVYGGVQQGFEIQDIHGPYVVTNVSDSGPGSLRQAIELADIDPTANGPDQISFATNISGGTIDLLSPLPALTRDQVTITGPITLDGTSAGAGDGLDVSGSEDSIQVLSITGFSGSGLSISGSDDSITGNQLVGNGTGDSGYIDGILVTGSGNTIGAASAGGVGLSFGGNLISGNSGAGVDIVGATATGNLVEGNLVGTDASGTSAEGNGFWGVQVSEAGQNTIGGSAAGAGNVISGNDQGGVAIFGSGSIGDVVQGNLIGTDITGTEAVGNAFSGVYVGAGFSPATLGSASGATIGGLAAGAGNVISANGNNGVWLHVSASNNVVEGNKIGTDITGNVALGNAQIGVYVDQGGSDNTIGGPAAGAGNLISGNGQWGVDLDGAATTGNTVQGNVIGLNASGTAKLGNGWWGMIIYYAPGNLIGGIAQVSRNIISGNNQGGITIVGATGTGNQVEGNIIGLGENGATPLGNGFSGVLLATWGGAFSAPSGNTIGGTSAGAGNIISANGNLGVWIADPGTDDNLVSGNLIGTDVSGTLARGNAFDGVLVQNGASGNTIGAGNVISANGYFGVEVSGSGTTDNTVVGSMVGTDITGTSPLGNGSGGIAIDGGATENTIGGESTGLGNLASANQGYGIIIEDAGTQGNLIAANFVGTNAAGTAPLGNTEGGVGIGLAMNNTVGGTATGARNVISGNPDDGVDLELGGQNVVEGNYIGTDAAGDSALGNGPSFGAVFVYEDVGDTIGGTTAGAGNLISGNVDIQVALYYATNISIQGNEIGTNAAGTSAFSNSELGVFLVGATGCTIGGVVAGAGNLISGNGVAGGVQLQDSNQNLVAGNLIGTTAQGNSALPNTAGVFCYGGSQNTIGGTTAAARNVISGNTGRGVILGTHNTAGETQDVVEGNYIGTDASGSSGLPNGGPGVFTFGGSGNTIGGTAGGAGNVISANGGAGITIADDNDLVAGNLVGTDGFGTQPLGNGIDGIDVSGDQNTIGGTSGESPNIVSANNGNGVELNGASNNLIAGNYVGTNSLGAANLGNSGVGILIGDSASNNTVGGTAAAAGNVIAFNGNDGVAVGLNAIDSSIDNAILANSIYSNAKLGIDLGSDGVTPNDSSGHSGPNLFQDYPVLSAAINSQATTVISGSLSGTPNTTYRVEFFSNPATDLSGHGQGQTFLTYATVTTDSSGAAAFTVDTPTAVPVGQSISATATDPAGNTSEFSADITVASPLAISSITPVSPNPRNTSVSTVDVTFSEAINTSSLAPGALTLTDNGGANLINNGVSLTLVAGDTYAIGGLAGLTASEGNFVLTVNAADIEDTYGNSGTGSATTSWLMDTTPPTSHVNSLPQRGNSLTFAVSVTGTDPNGQGGSPPSGVSTYSIYSSTNGGSWGLWTTVPANNPTANFTGQSNTTYAFYSIALDLAGNTEVKAPTIEASTYLPDLTPPVTTVDGTTGANPTTVNNATGTFNLNMTGSDPGGSVLTYFEVFVSVDSGTYQTVNGTAIPAGPADSSGNVHASIFYQCLTDGASHKYAFYSTGIDGAGNIQSPPSTPNLSLTETFAQATPAQLQVSGLTVENGAVERSYVRYLEIDFNESDSQSISELTSIVNSVNNNPNSSSAQEIKLYQYNLNGTGSPTQVSVQNTLKVIDHAIEIDFGAGGIGGSPSTTTADGYYELDVKLPNGTTAVHHFYRLLGDVTGDGTVDNNDLNEIAAEINLSSQTGMTALNADVNGDGTVSALDLTLATRSKGRKLASGLSLG